MTNLATLWQLIYCFGNVKDSLPKCCHVIAGLYIAGSDQFHSNGFCAIAGNFMAVTSLMGKVHKLFNFSLNGDRGKNFLECLKCILFATDFKKKMIQPKNWSFWVALF